MDKTFSGHENEGYNTKCLDTVVNNRGALRDTLWDSVIHFKLQCEDLGCILIPPQMQMQRYVAPHFKSNRTAVVIQLISVTSYGISSSVLPCD